MEILIGRYRLRTGVLELVPVMVLKIPTNSGSVNGNRYLQLSKVLRGPYSGEEEQMGRLDRAGADDNLTIAEETGTNAIEGDLHTAGAAVFNDDAQRLCPRM